MDKITGYKMTDYCSVSQIKKRLKNYLKDTNCSEYKINNFGQSLVLTLVSILEELIMDSLQYVSKHDKTGLYSINILILRLLVNESSKYNFTLKYLKKFEQKLSYHDSLFFNMKKVLDLLEKNLGDKLMLEIEAKNFISYILLSIQYEITELGLLLVKYSKKKTLSKNTLINCINFMLDDSITGKIKLKLDCELHEELETEADLEEEAEVELVEELEEEDESSDNDSEINVKVAQVNKNADEKIVINSNVVNSIELENVKDIIEKEQNSKFKKKK